MAGFDSGTAVEAMDFNFEAHGGPKGVIPDPSQKKMRKFQRAAGEIQREFKLLMKANEDDDKNPTLSAEELNALADKADALSDKLDDVIAEMCSGIPSAEEVHKLPHRVKMAFTEWLMEQFRPEASTAATKQ
jgi:hypothetical protein